MKSINQTDVLSGTTTSFSRLRGMTLWIMGILQGGGSVPSWEVAQQTAKSCRYVNVYLNRLRKYGIALKKEEFWFLTDFGEYLCCSLCERERESNNSLSTKNTSNNDKNVSNTNNDVSHNRHKYNTSITQGQHKYNTSLPKKLVQVSIQAWLRDSSPGEAERVVVDMLVKHFNKTGSKFVLVKDHYAMSELLSINVGDVGDVLARLRQENIIYLMRDPTSGLWKLGLKKAFVELLEREGSK